jgi:hypothetical protein
LRTVIVGGRRSEGGPILPRRRFGVQGKGIWSLVCGIRASVQGETDRHFNAVHVFCGQ